MIQVASSIKRAKSYLPYLYLICAQLMVAINVVGSKVISTHISVLPALFLRFSIATVVSVLLCLAFKADRDCLISLKKIPLTGWIFLTLQGLCAGGLFNAFIFLGLQTVDASLAGMILSVLPAVIALVAVLFLKESLTLRRSLCILLAIGGVMVLHYAPSTKASSSFGILLVFFSLMPEAAYYLLIKAYRPPVNIFVKSVLLNVVNVVGLLPFVLYYGCSLFKTLDLLTLEVLLVTGSSATVFFICWYLGAKNMMASRSGIFTTICPLLTVLLSMIFLGERLGSVQAIGMLVIMSSVFVSSLGE